MCEEEEVVLFVNLIYNGKLPHCGLVTPYDAADISQRWFRW